MGPTVDISCLINIRSAHFSTPSCHPAPFPGPNNPWPASRLSSLLWVLVYLFLHHFLNVGVFASLCWFSERMCRWTCQGAQVWRSGNYLHGICFLSPPYGIWGLNSGWQAWCQAPLLSASLALFSSFSSRWPCFAPLWGWMMGHRVSTHFVHALICWWMPRLI